jgi:hypothetical protein
MLKPICGLVAALVIALSTPAAADKPSSKEAIKAAKAWRAAVKAEPAPAALNRALALTGAPFSYTPRGRDSPDDAPDACAAKAADKLGEPDAIRALLDCVMHNNFIDDEAYGAPTWKVVSLSSMPARLRKQAKKLAALTKTHALVLESLFIPAPATEWALYAVGRDASGALRIDAVIRDGE